MSAVIHPGDTVLIGAREDLDPDNATALKERLQARFPGVEFVVLGGLTVEGVVRPGDQS